MGNFCLRQRAEHMDSTMSEPVKEDFGIFVGSETGLIKGLNVEKKKWGNLNKVEEANRENEINVICWDNDEETRICVGRRNQQFTIYDTNNFEALETKDCTGGTGPFRGIGKINGDLLTCTESGLVKLWTENENDQVQFEV